MVNYQVLIVVYFVNVSYRRRAVLCFDYRKRTTDELSD